MATAAQDVPTVFVHGIFSSSDAWRATSQRLANVLQIAPLSASTCPRPRVLETQTAALNGAFGGLPANTIAIGHSQGGLITRQWSRTKALRGILTLGTPHTGSQLTARGLDLINFNYMVYNLAGLALRHVVGAGLRLAGRRRLAGLPLPAQWLSWNGAAALASSVAVAGYVRWRRNWCPGRASSTASTPSATWPARTLAVAKRVALVYTATDYWRAGIAVGLAPSLREQAWDIIQVTPPVFDFAAAWLDTNFPPTHFLARSFAMRLRNLAARDARHGSAVVLGGHRRSHLQHPARRHRLGGQPALSRPAARSTSPSTGPAHTQETQAERRRDLVGAHRGDGRGRPRRAAATAARRAAAAAAPARSPAANASTPTSRSSPPTARVALRYQSDGNLVLYGSGGACCGTPAPWGISAGRAEMQTDGNFVIYDAPATAGLGHRHLGARRLSQGPRRGLRDGARRVGVGIWWSGSGSVVYGDRAAAGYARRRAGGDGDDACCGRAPRSSRCSPASPIARAVSVRRSTRARSRSGACPAPRAVPRPTTATPPISCRASARSSPSTPAPAPSAGAPAPA